MGRDRIRTKVQSSSSLIPRSKPKKFSFLQPRYQDQVETDSSQNNQQPANPKLPLLTHSFGRVSVFPIQAKLTIGQPNDKYEQEADRVASQVVQQISNPATAQPTTGQSLQRMEEPEEEELQAKPQISAIQRSLFPPMVQRMDMTEEEEELQAKPIISPIQRSLLSPTLQREDLSDEDEDLQPKSSLQRSLISPVVQRMDTPEEEEELQTKPIISPIQRSLFSPVVQRTTHPVELMLQRREAIAGGEASTNLDSAINSARGGGQSLEPGLQQSMGQAMRADFSEVRIHTDAKSDQLNQSIQAKAFTTGQDVFFRQGEYQPGSWRGQELIAHELTHVVQQKGKKQTTARRRGKRHQSCILKGESRRVREEVDVGIQRAVLEKPTDSEISLKDATDTIHFLSQKVNERMQGVSSASDLPELTEDAVERANQRIAVLQQIQNDVPSKSQECYELIKDYQGVLLRARTNASRNPQQNKMKE